MFHVIASNWSSRLFPVLQLSCLWVGLFDASIIITLVSISHVLSYVLSFLFISLIIYLLL